MTNDVYFVKTEKDAIQIENQFHGKTRIRSFKGCDISARLHDLTPSQNGIDQSNESAV